MRFCFTYILLATVFFTSCIKNESDCSTDLPAGAVRIVLDWGGIGEGIDIPQSYYIYMICNTSGKSYSFPGMTEPDNILCGIESRCYSIYTYTDASDIMISGHTASVNNANNRKLPYVCPEPGWLFSARNSATVLKGDTLVINALMYQQVRQLTIKFNVIGDEDVSLAECSGRLRGVAGNLCLESDYAGCPSYVNMVFCEQDEDITATVYLLGIVPEERQILSLSLDYGDGHGTAEFDLSDMLADFNADKHIPMELQANLTVSKAGMTATITDWEDNTQYIVPS